MLVQAASKGGNKENRPRVARAKGEKRAKRTGKASAADSMLDLVVSMQLPLNCCSALCAQQPWRHVESHHCTALRQDY
jgi:hypothetical protein